MFKVKLADAKKTLEFLLDQWGKAYVWGVENDELSTGKVKSWDCSELVQYAFKLFMNIVIPDGSFNQYEFCKTYGYEIYYPLNKDVQPLDLIFLWDRDMRQISHVGIVFGEMTPVGGVMLIEARGKPFSSVMFTPLDKMMIEFNKRFAGIFRIVEING